MRTTLGRWAAGAAVLLALAWAGAPAARGASSQPPAAQEALAPAGPPPSAVGIWGWGLVGAGFLGVAVTAARGRKPRRKRRAVPVAGSTRRPAKVARSIYTPPPDRRYRQGREKRW